MELKVEYQVSIKHNFGSKRVPLLKTWKELGTFETLEEISKKYFNLPKHNFIEESGDSSKIYTFEIIPEWGAHKTEEWENYNKRKDFANYCHIKVKPILTLDEI
ncbi:MAG: hypothetical protein KAS15_09130 [Nanoarchaeota archaeon]|nr:hypothetical protein [Nanoarchaeota archaeon]